MSFDTVLAGFKAAENKEVALLVMEDPALRNLLAVWPVVAIERLGDEAEDWSGLWRAVRFSEEEAAELAGVSLGVAKLSIRRAIGLRLIYPDGSLHGLARMALQKRIKDTLQG